MKKVLITKLLNKRDKKRLLSAGILYDMLPALRFSFNVDLKVAVKYLEDPEGHWIFTSHRSVKSLESQIQEASPPAGILTVGKKSARLLAKLGKETTFSGNQSEDLLPLLSPGNVHQAYFFRGENFRDTIPTHCKANGIPLKSLTCYQAVPNSIRFQPGEYSCVWVFSPASSRSVIEGNDIPPDFPFYAIGPVTADYLQSKGFNNVHFCEKPSFKNLIDEYLKNHT